MTHFYFRYHFRQSRRWRGRRLGHKLDVDCVAAGRERRGGNDLEQNQRPLAVFDEVDEDGAGEAREPEAVGRGRRAPVDDERFGVEPARAECECRFAAGRERDRVVAAYEEEEGGLSFVERRRRVAGRGGPSDVRRVGEFEVESGRASPDGRERQPRARVRLAVERKTLNVRSAGGRARAFDAESATVAESDGRGGEEWAADDEAADARNRGVEAEVAPRSSLPGRPRGVVLYISSMMRRTVSCVRQGEPANVYA